MSEAAPQTPRAQLGRAVSSIWWIPLVRGILLIILGGYALFRPGMTAIALTQVIGFFLIAEGILAFVAAILGDTSSRFWTLVRGALAILIGIFVIVWFGIALIYDLCRWLCIDEADTMTRALPMLWPPNRRCSRPWSYGTRGGTRFARVHRAILLDPPQLNAIR